MTPERKSQVKQLREKLANLSPEQRQELTSRGFIATIEGRTLSAHNTMMVYMQTPGIFGGNGCQLPSVVGGYRQRKPGTCRG